MPEYLPKTTPRLGNYEPIDNSNKCNIQPSNYISDQHLNLNSNVDKHKLNHGHCGEKVVLETKLEKVASLKTIGTFGWSTTNSDKIPLDRTPKDLRMEECKKIDYPENLPTAIVIFVFHNEAFSTLMRSVHTVIRQTPKRLLKHILLVDDASTRDHLQDLLENYLEDNFPDGFVKGWGLTKG